MGSCLLTAFVKSKCIVRAKTLLCASTEIFTIISFETGFSLRGKGKMDYSVLFRFDDIIPLKNGVHGITLACARIFGHGSACCSLTLACVLVM
ncbi:hypothetical protein TorRG33x02_111370 [Trema orientale]|uniref:Uncharacterized protein n=1 Tax=Trema orientale TaxID=63057 RepID=A0A2P5F615_TREOI|nr:hypothetical protein TorRG33x02_111370 [Trema orientale]